jgi:alkylation response protein AidB-like acyl-CoA dehydrogenase
MEEAGRVCLPGPLLDVVLAAHLLAAAGGQGAPPAPIAALLGEIAAGTRLVTIARDDAPFAGDPAGTTWVEGTQVRGRKFFVPFAASADALIAVTPDGPALVQGPFETLATPTLDLAQRFAEVRFDHEATLLGPPALLEATDRLAAVGAAAMLLGVMTRALEMTLDYVQTREAFRKPIGAFQALQHRLADMLLRAESTRSAVYRAAWCLAALDPKDPEAPLAAATAKAFAGEAARHVCGEAIQMHGGIGFTWELDLHYWFKRAKTLEQHYGSTEVQLERALAAADL